MIWCHIHVSCNVMNLLCQRIKNKSDMLTEADKMHNDVYKQNLSVSNLIIQLKYDCN